MSDAPEHDIQRFIEIFEASDLTTLRIVTPALELHLSRGQEVEPAAVPAAPERVQQPPASVSDQPQPAEAAAVASRGHVVRAPMVGTVYRSPEPGEPPFVEVGDEVDAASTVCLVEAMKVFMAVAAGAAGVVEEFHVSTGDLVEYDQPLLRIAPTSTTTGV